MYVKLREGIGINPFIVTGMRELHREPATVENTTYSNAELDRVTGLRRRDQVLTTREDLKAAYDAFNIARKPEFRRDLAARTQTLTAQYHTKLFFDGGTAMEIHETPAEYRQAVQDQLGNLSPALLAAYLANSRTQGPRRTGCRPGES